MLEMMEGLEEYNNAGALFGLDGAEGEELLGALRKMNPIRRQRTINWLASGAIPSKGSRAEFERFFPELPKHILQALKKGELRLADTLLYSIKRVTSKTVKMFETQDTKAVGINSLSGAKLQKNQVLVVSGIIVLAGVPSDTTPDKIMSANYEKIENFPAIASGEFNLKSNKKVIVPESSMSLFRTSNFTGVPLGYYKLANPRIIIDDVLVEATFELGSTEGLDPRTHIYLGLHGTITTP